MKYTYFVDNFVNIGKSGKKFRIGNEMLGELWSVYDPHYISFMEGRKIETKVIPIGNGKLRLIRNGKAVENNKGEDIEFDDEFTEVGKIHPRLSAEIKTHALDKATAKKLPTEMLHEIGSYIGGKKRKSSTRKKRKHMRRKKTRAYKK